MPGHALSERDPVPKRKGRTVLARGRKRDKHWGRKWGRT